MRGCEWKRMRRRKKRRMKSLKKSNLNLKVGYDSVLMIFWFGWLIELIEVIDLCKEVFLCNKKVKMVSIEGKKLVGSG